MSGRYYVPDYGDVVWLDPDPQAGHEQTGRRPALVLGPARYNGKAGLMACCPLTTKVKGYPFEVLTDVDGLSRAILANAARRNLCDRYAI